MPSSNPAFHLIRHDRLPLEPSLREQDAVIDLLNARRFADAEAKARALQRRFPRNGFPSKALAAVLAGQERWQESLSLYERALPMCGQDWQFLNNYANALKMTGNLPESVNFYRRAIELAPPRTMEPSYNLGLALVDMGRLQEAEQALLVALQINPLHGSAHMNLGNLYNVQARLREAELHYRAALLSCSGDERLLNNLGLCLRRQHRYGEAESFFRKALEVNPRYATGLSNLAEFMALHGFMRESVELLRHAIAEDPSHAEAHSNLLFTMAHVDGMSPEELLDEHLAFAKQFEQPLRSTWRQHENSPEPERALRIGFVSADLRDHPVVRYLRPSLEVLRQGAWGFTLVAYNNSTQQDAETERYRPLFHEWHDVAHLGDEAMAEKLRHDGIDVLFDLSGHTGYNRLLTFARKPAPVQISWMGYVGTTGLEAMDYFIADPLLVPDTMRDQFREKLLMLPATTCFAPCEDAPEISPLPCLARGQFTFACLARMNKLNRRAVRLWSRILRAVPASRLMLSTMGDGNPPQPLLAWFAEEGIDRERLHFVHVTSVEQMLALHAEIDLALDTMPYSGSTSSNHSLWMGVPTVTLAGQMPVGRMGVALNTLLGLDELLAHSEEQYVQKAVTAAASPEWLLPLRPTLRERFRACALGQPETVTTALAQSIREVWRTWCVKQNAPVR